MNKSDLKKLLFSSEGRIGRKTFILTSLALAGSLLLIILIDTLIVGLLPQINETVAKVFAMILCLVEIILGIAFAVVGVILGIKRYHDRNKSGWWVLISLIPYIGGLWYFIETWFFKGTEGENRFGADPLAK